MSTVERKPVKDVALLRMALRRTSQQTETTVEKSVDFAQGLADPEVAAQTVAVIGHLADRVRVAEQNTAVLVDVLQSVAEDSSASRRDLLEALGGITERLAEAPVVNVTVPVPEISVNVETPARQKDIQVERDSSGKIIGYRVDEALEEEVSA